jgi:hypothetical protein
VRTRVSEMLGVRDTAGKVTTLPAGDRQRQLSMATSTKSPAHRFR